MLLVVVMLKKFKKFKSDAHTICGIPQMVIEAAVTKKRSIASEIKILNEEIWTIWCIFTKTSTVIIFLITFCNYCNATSGVTKYPIYKSNILVILEQDCGHSFLYMHAST